VNPSSRRSNSAPARRDECVARSIIERLRADGFDVVAVIDVSPSEEDDQVLARAYEDGRVLITADKDFGDLVIRLGQATRGVINVALGDLAAATRAEIVAARLQELGDRVVGSLVTIEPSRVRLRPLPTRKS
jgi:predicted nuclease of predicted toxin-antitoxin system